MSKSKKRKPSFDAPEDAGTGAAATWVYRSGAGAPDEASVEATSPGAAADAAPDAEPAPALPVVAAARTEIGASQPQPIAGAPAPAATRDREKAAHRLVDRYARYAAAAGLVPLPLFDVAAIGGVQVAMLSALAGHYHVPFSRERGKALVASLLGGVMPAFAGHQVFRILGPLAGMISVSGFAVAATCAVGRVFIAHFESGGTLHDVDVERSRRQLAAQLAEGAASG